MIDIAEHLFFSRPDPLSSHSHTIPRKSSQQNDERRPKKENTFIDMADWLTDTTCLNRRGQEEEQGWSPSPSGSAFSLLWRRSLSSRKYIHLSLFDSTPPRPPVLPFGLQDLPNHPRFWLQIFIQSARFVSTRPPPSVTPPPQGLRQSIFGFPPKWRSHISLVLHGSIFIAPIIDWKYPVAN